MSITTDVTTTRNANLGDLVTMLQAQQVRKLDVVVPASKLSSHRGSLFLAGVAPVISEDGVSDPNGLYRPTDVADEQIAEKLGIPVPYLKRLRRERPGLFDQNVNSLLAGDDDAAADSRSFLLRTFTGLDGGSGILRAFVTDRFGIIDHLDTLMAVLSGIREADVNVDVVGADLSERNMFVRIAAPGIAAHAPALLKDYRSPFSGNRGDENPTVFAGIEIRNSEVGKGSMSITPRITFEVCSNGMTLTKDVMRAVHVGSRMDEGIIPWSEDTQSKALALTTAKARDAVAAFLNVEYVTRTIAGLEAAAGIEVTNAPETIKVLSKALAFDQDTQNGILSHFIKGGDTTAGGILHAVTSWAQNTESPDEAARLEGVAIKAMELAASTA